MKGQGMRDAYYHIRPQITDDQDPRLWAELNFRNLDRDDVILIHNPKKDETAIIDDRLRFHKPG
jgi:hypothetical protein